MREKSPKIREALMTIRLKQRGKEENVLAFSVLGRTKDVSFPRIVSLSPLPPASLYPRNTTLKGTPNTGRRKETLREYNSVIPKSYT